MSFPEFIVYLLVFALVWLIFPRSGFAWVLALYLVYTKDLPLFQPVAVGNPMGWATIFVFLGVLIGIFLDVREHLIYLKAMKTKITAFDQRDRYFEG